MKPCVLYILVFEAFLLILPLTGMFKYPEIDCNKAKKLYEKWKKKHAKSYHPSLEINKYETFLGSLKNINKLNRQGAGYPNAPTFGLTPFVDLTPEEFQQRYLNSFVQIQNVISRKTRSRLKRIVSNESVTGYFDWSNYDGVVTSVKDQGSTGACWAFAGCANIEGLWAIKTGSPSPNLSVEAILDCNGIFNRRAIACGPNGGNPQGFYEFVINEEGMMEESDYPFCIHNGSCSPCAPPNYSELYCGPWSNSVPKCSVTDSCAAKYNRSLFIPGLQVRDYIILGQNECELATSLKNIGPVTAVINARTLQYYVSGVLRQFGCYPRSPNHVILLTGYNIVEDGTSYWIAKNSWGTLWGEGGFVRITYGVGACGVNLLCATGVLA